MPTAVPDAATTEQSPFETHLEVFDGPLDLLLTLVRRGELDISTVSLAQVTGQYLAYMARLEELEPGALAAFCDVAATLLLLKSREMLPRKRRSEEDLDEEDPGELAARLAAYARYREVAERLGTIEARGLRAYVRVAPQPPDLPPKLDPGSVSPDDLAAAFRAALASLDEDEAPVLDEVKPHTYRIADRVGAIRQRLSRGGRATFLEVLTEGPRTRDFIIVSFLAVLEMLRRGMIRVAQDELFQEIVIESLDLDVADDSSDDDGSFVDAV